MTFEQAIEAVHRGQRVTRRAWPTLVYITAYEGRVWHHVCRGRQCYMETAEDIAATDWYIGGRA